MELLVLVIADNDQRIEGRIFRDITSEVVVGVEDFSASVQCSGQSLTVLVERYIEHGDFVAGADVNSSQQVDVAF